MTGIYLRKIVITLLVESYPTACRVKPDFQHFENGPDAIDVAKR
jgi:hypothetical protein